MDDPEGYRSLLFAMLERAILDVVQEKTIYYTKISRKGVSKDYCRYQDRQTKKDIKSAYEFINSEAFEELVNIFEFQLPIEKIRKKCEEEYLRKKSFRVEKEKESIIITP